MTRLKKGTAEDLESALDLEKMALVTDRVQEIFEEFALSEDEALWAAALSFLGTFNSTDEFADTSHMVVAARAFLKEAGDVFESLPTGEEEDNGTLIEDDDEEDDAGDDEDGEPEVEA